MPGWNQLSHQQFCDRDPEGGNEMRNVILATAAIALIVGGSSFAMAQATGTTPSTTATSPSTNQGTSGTSTGGMMSEAQVKQHLEQEGYTNITGLKEDSNGMWMGKAMHGGKEVTVDVDKSGKVTAK
jgi:hypothetical protein